MALPGKQRLIFVVLGIAVLAGGIYAGGRTVLAGGDNYPGSSEDPLVARSYVAQAVNDKAAVLSQQVLNLQTRINALEQKVVQLERQLGQQSSGSTGPVERPAPPPAQPAARTAKVSDPSGARLRGGPGASYITKQVLPQGTEVEIVGSAGEWSEVRLADGTDGWIATELLQ